MASIKPLTLQILIIITHYWYIGHGNKITSYTIGALLSNETMIKVFKDSVNKENMFYQSLGIRFDPKAELMAQRALKAAEQVCELISATKKRMFTLIVSHPPDSPDTPPLSASFTCAFYSIPVMGISARQSAFSDKYSHSSFLRTVPPYSEEARVWTELIREFKWREISLVYSDDQEGKTLLSRLERTSDDSKHFRITRTVSFPADEDEDLPTNFTELLRPIKTEQTRAVALYAKPEFARRIMDAATGLGMLQKDWAWVVTEQVLKMDHLPQGLIGLQLAHSSETSHIMDAVTVVTKGIYNAYTRNKVQMSIVNAPGNCGESPTDVKTKVRKASPIPWLDIGKNVYESMRLVEVPKGVTGLVKFDEKGDRVLPVYNIVNVHSSISGSRLVKVGTYGIKREKPSDWDTKEPFIDLLQLEMGAIIWPGNNTVDRKKEVCIEKKSNNQCGKKGFKLLPAAPKSFMKKTKLLVVTKVSIPFVYKRVLKSKDEKCLTSSNPTELNKEVPCWHKDPKTEVVSHYCCRGYCIDLLRRLANRSGIEENFTPFSYDLHLVGDGEVGQEKMENDSKKWTGMVGELTMGLADLAVAPMTITPDRASRVEFTKPFKYLGLTILVKKELSRSNLASFLQPFENTLWVLVALSVHVVALVLYLLDRFSPFGRFKLAKSSNTEEDALNLSSAMWFAWGVLLNSGIGEGTPRSFSARVLGMVWAGFAMIIVASYTANLAAFLVLDRPEAIISGIDDARLRNPQKNFKFGTVRGSPVEQYFKRQVEYATMYRTMESYNLDSAEDAIESVKKGDLKAFIWDSARISFEASSTCDLITAGEVFGRNGYGLAMKKDNPWLYEMSQAVLNFHERGFMESLDTKWILVKAEGCDRTESSPATLGLTNMAGVFIMVAAGIVAGVFLIFIEIAYKKRRGLKEKELELAKNAVDRWRSNIEKRKILRKTLSAESDFHRYFNSIKGGDGVGDSSGATGSLLINQHPNNISFSNNKDTRIFFDNEIQV